MADYSGAYEGYDFNEEGPVNTTPRPPKDDRVLLMEAYVQTSDTEHRLMTEIQEREHNLKKIRKELQGLVHKIRAVIGDDDLREQPVSDEEW